MNIRNFVNNSSLFSWIRQSYRYLRYIRDYRTFSRLSEKFPKRFPLAWHNRYPCLNDNTGTTAFDHHYVYHPAWAARILAQTKPSCHVDISSTLSFCTLVSAFLPVKFYDFRPAEINLSGLSSEHADITALPFEDGSIPSLSCMHTVEHIGLGRYGDPLDPEGDQKAIVELRRVLAPGGNLLFVVPVGKDAKIMFNAHRIYTFAQISAFFREYQLVNYALIPDNPELQDFIEHADPALTDHCTYACGCFWFRKE